MLAAVRRAAVGAGPQIGFGLGYVEGVVGLEECPIGGVTLGDSNADALCALVDCVLDGRGIPVANCF